MWCDRGFATAFALPNDGGAPTFSRERFTGRSIAQHVALELGSPELFARLRHCRALATLMSMPEASVYEESQFEARED